MALRFAVSGAVACATVAFCAVGLQGCGGGGGASSALPPGPLPPTAPPGSGAPAGYKLNPLVATSSTGSCNVSYDGFTAYTVPAGSFAPIDVSYSRCSGGVISDQQVPVAPSWAHSLGSTQAMLTVVSLQEAYSPDGMAALATVAHARGLPVTWMIGNDLYESTLADRYNSYHAQYGDDVQVEPTESLLAGARSTFSWYVPRVSVEGAGHERNIARARSLGENAFWGITWNSLGTDSTFDQGAPWGAYCADPNSYKRPAPDGSCSVVALEWTARDLTRAYFSSREDAFSTDPDDVLMRAGFDAVSARAYMSAVMDAYAGAGASQPIVVIAQQESAEMALNPQDSSVLDALYAGALNAGMTAVTLAQAADRARAFAAKPRAVAFPYISGGLPTYYRGAPFTPATIDYHDSTIGMTFIAGHTTPSRTFPYAKDPISSFMSPLAEADSLATLQRSAFSNGTLYYHFSAPTATRYGIALWSDPTLLRLSGNVVSAGRAGAVVVFDLAAGESDVAVPCGGCTGAALPYSI